jgi:hypothetical protein
MTIASQLESHDFSTGNLSFEFIIMKVKEEHNLNPDLIKYLVRYYLQDNDTYGSVRGVNGGVYNKNIKTTKQLKREKVESIKNAILDKL